MVNNVSKYSIEACCICIKEYFSDYEESYPEPRLREVNRCLVELDDHGAPYFTIYTRHSPIKCTQEWFSDHFKLYGGRR